jgi:hypothetical protein
MSLSEKVERLARMVPGVSGYQDKESSRDTDKNIRLRVATELEQLKRDLEHDKRRLMERKDLSHLPALDRVASQLDKLANTVRYASRGYSGVFDSNKLDVKKLDQLCTFDLQLMDEMAMLKTQAKQAHDSHGDETALKQAIEDLSHALDEFEKTFSTRQDVLMAR